jgi:hypothetical protein
MASLTRIQTFEHYENNEMNLPTLLRMIWLIPVSCVAILAARKQQTIACLQTAFEATK